MLIIGLIVFKCCGENCSVKNLVHSRSLLPCLLVLIERLVLATAEKSRQQQILYKAGENYN
tara:strand:- start:309 stop:491 length:183 start_codon:yes stop_codon:yes gene_type:complete